eukprot:COSAG02_NODE_13758_length_1353_cov_1.669059_2_plen_112_part_00
MDDDKLDADYINRHIRPSILTLSIINKLLEEVAHETAKQEKLEVTLILSFLTGLYTLVHWFFTELCGTSTTSGRRTGTTAARPDGSHLMITFAKVTLDKQMNLKSATQLDR